MLMLIYQLICVTQEILVAYQRKNVFVTIYVDNYLSFSLNFIIKFTVVSLKVFLNIGNYLKPSSVTENLTIS
jgi:hypothetical protein